MVDKTQQVLAGAVSRRGGTVSGTIGLLACLALVVGYFLPWTSMSEVVQGGLGLSQQILADDAVNNDNARAAAQELQAGQAISAADWTKVLDAVEDSGDFDERGQRVIQVARIGLLALPYVGAVLALLLLTLAITPGRLTRMGLAPVAGIVALAQSRFLSTILLVIVMACALIVFAVSQALFAGATLLGHGEQQIGTGSHLMSLGSGTAFVSAFLGYGPGRLRAVISSLVLILAAVIAGWFYIR